MGRTEAYSCITTVFVPRTAEKICRACIWLYVGLGTCRNLSVSSHFPGPPSSIMHEYADVGTFDFLLPPLYGPAKASIAICMRESFRPSCVARKLTWPHIANAFKSRLCIDTNSIPFVHLHTELVSSLPLSQTGPPRLQPLRVTGSSKFQVHPQWGLQQGRLQVF